MTGRLIFVLGDQLSRGLSALADIDPSQDVVLMVEVREEGTYVPHHKQKIAFLLSAMRHFADDLRAEGLRVDYVRLDDPDNTHSFTGELARAVARHKPQSVIVTRPGEWRVGVMVATWSELLGVSVAMREDTRFFCSVEDFAALTARGKTKRMENFYREMRRRTGFLMAAGKPIGGKWNYDAENRKALPKGHKLPKRKRFAPDAITRDVMALVEAQFPDHFGDLARFGWPVTRAEALQALDDFITHALPQFGDWQDAMKTGENFLYHALLSPALNVGLLTAAEVCEAAEAAYEAGHVPLNAAEGFIRQILGWREFVRGLYWTEMPAYGQTNALKATRPLPEFYWSGQTKMHCIAEVVRGTRQNAYAHHIQRLMVTGNFALLAGIAPAEIEAWYLAVYADAFDWVELPNTHGMVAHADGGRLGSKPYAASAAYIGRMSDYCRGCRYDAKARTGANACPFNYLYWNFLIAHRDTFGANPRMALPYKALDRFDKAEQAAIRAAAEDFLAKMHTPEGVPPAQMSLGDW
ncbi:cryptochrome/photolyase family protein [Rhodobacter sp. TJ_12]|uniref:cryptochrome/photolyase family protein n=1 Tax=Rhodobacter sp. TJ_12 TaxID=2029399 RepID=UPI001CBE455E|nr:cryptochrome/photolyase family protein [Rhodobacter sp. TJ_12]MBZ4021332.1 cryptochrome/photolyase family protein [Rhodobacter sp. TJ_12]